MTHTNKALVGALAAACLLVVTGCNGGESGSEPTATTAPPAATATTSPDAAPTTVDPASTTTEPPTLTPEEQDEADVETTLQAYIEALDAAYVEEGDIEGIYPYSSGVARETWVTQLMAYRSEGLSFEGGRVVDVLEIQLNGDQADVLACVDYTGSRVFDADGEDITPERPGDGLILNDYVVERADWAEHGWAVSGDTSRRKPCGD